MQGLNRNYLLEKASYWDGGDWSCGQDELGMDTIFFPSTFFLLWAFPNFIDTHRNYSCFCLCSKITAAMKLKHACSWKESYNKLKQYIKKS